jgi:SET domain-containing protein
VFAARDIPKDTVILEYFGIKITKAESQRRAEERLARAKETGEAAVYIFDLNSRYDLDGSDIEPNDARFINHSCAPNCEAYQDGNRIFIHAETDIKKGEELVYNYGFNLDNWAEHPCLCGAKNCVGFIVGKEFWPKLLKIMQKRADTVRAARKKLAKKDKPAAKKSTKKPAKRSGKSARR